MIAASSGQAVSTADLAGDFPPQVAYASTTSNTEERL